MRTFTFIFSYLIILNLTGCRSGTDSLGTQDAADTGKAVLVFQEYEHDFGKVKEGEKISYEFKYENRGSGPLAFTAVTTTCGCTVPKYNTKPVKPGEGGNLEVVFDTSGRNGVQTKTITVRSNAAMPVVLLKITAEVEQN